MLALGIYSILVISLSARWFITFSLASSSIEEYNSVCNYPNCIERDALYRKNINPYNDPCENFFEYACGNWRLHNEIPNYDVQWTVSHAVSLAAYSDVRKLLEDKRLMKDNPELIQARRIYELCNKFPFLKRGDANFLKNFTDVYWPMFPPENGEQIHQSPWWMIDSHYLGITGESAFFDISIKANPYRNNTSMFEMKGLYSPYGSIIHSLDWKKSEYSSYLKYLINLVGMYAPNGTSQNFIKESLIRVIKFRKELAKIIRRITQKKYNSYKPMTIKKFQAWYDKLVNIGLSVKINWLIFMHSIMQYDGNEFIEENVMINVVQKSYFVKLVEELKKTNEDTIVNHIHIYFLERHMIPTTEMKEILDDVLYRGPETVGEIRFDQPRWYMCVVNHNMKDVLGKMYVTVRFAKEIQEPVERMMKDIQGTIENQISQSSWLDMESKIWARAKINLTTSWIGYPPWYDDPSLKRIYQDIDMYPVHAHIHLLREKNHMVINAASLQAPMYEAQMPYVVNYGSMGLIIAHELYHSFDEKGIGYDSTGVLKQPKLKLLKKYKEQQKCFVDQHRNLCARKLQLSSEEAQMQCSTLTYNEDLVDIMGAKAAYQTYKTISMNNQSECSALPSFLNCEKLFFISLANALCGAVSPHYIRRYMQYTIHSMPELRLNGIVSNMPEFSKAFQCPWKSPMNAAKRCDLWQ